MEVHPVQELLNMSLPAGRPEKTRSEMGGFFYVS